MASRSPRQDVPESLRVVSVLVSPGSNQAVVEDLQQADNARSHHESEQSAQLGQQVAPT